MTKEVRILHTVDAPRRQALCSLCGFWCMSRWFVNDKPACPDCAKEERVTFGSAFAGVGGFDRGLERAGMTSKFQIEIDAFCRRVLARHWPHVARHEDVRSVGGNDLESVDVLCGGFPCQDLSIAGKRKGLKGERSGLFYEFTRIAAELRPTWVLLENVDGLLSAHDGEDFRLVLRELEDVGYVGAWRVLDSRWFGVPQRRNRVFLVGCLRGSGRRSEAVLFESARSGWDSPPRNEARAHAAGCARDGVAFALSAVHRGVGQGHNTNYLPEAVATALTASMGHHGHSSPRGDGRDNLVVGALGAAGHGWTCGPDEAAAGQAVMEHGGVRRLTPLECERLQGFPDGYTCLCGCLPYATRACVCKDGPRYKALGNAVTVPVIEWIGGRLMEAERAA